MKCPPIADLQPLCVVVIFFVYRRRLASLSDSSRHRMSSSRTIRDRLVPDFNMPLRNIESAICIACRSSERTGSLDVSDDRTGLVLEELDANLGDTTARACQPTISLLSPTPSNAQIVVFRTGSAQDSGDLHELDGLLIHCRN